MSSLNSVLSIFNYMRKCTSCRNNTKLENPGPALPSLVICVLLFYLRFAFSFAFCFFICVLLFYLCLTFLFACLTLLFTFFLFFIFVFFLMCVFFFNVFFFFAKQQISSSFPWTTKLHFVPFLYDTSHSI